MNCFYFWFRDHVVFLKSILFTQPLQSHSPQGPVPERCHNVKNSIHATETNSKGTQVLNLHFWKPWKGCRVSAVFFRILLCSVPLPFMYWDDSTCRALPTPEKLSPSPPRPLCFCISPHLLLNRHDWEPGSGQSDFLRKEKRETLSRFRQSPYLAGRERKSQEILSGGV